MKNIIKSFVVILAVTLSIANISCDKFDTLPLNIPFSFNFSASGSNTQYNSGNYCFDVNSETFKDNQDKIKKITFIEAAYRTKTISDPALQVTLNIRVLNSLTDTDLINFSIQNFKPGDYISKPLVLTFDQTQVQALNTYLVSNKCLRAIITHTGNFGSQSITGAVDMVLEAETEL